MQENLPPLRRLGNWFRGLWRSYLAEVQDRILMSPKRFIKFLGILLIPIIYGVICMVAFWSPADNIGRAPVAFMDLDHKIILVKNFQTIEDSQLNEESFNQADTPKNLTYQIGALLTDDEKSTDFGDGIDDKLASILDTKEAGKLTLKLNSGQIVNYDPTKTDVEITSTWDIFKKYLNPKKDPNIPDTEYKFTSDKINNKIAFTNVHYLNDASKIDKQWKGAKYYVQAKIPDNFMANFFGWLGETIASWPQNGKADNFATDWKDQMQSLDIWTTFERNYMFGYYMQTFSTMASGIVIQAIPSFFSNFVTGNLMTQLSVTGKQLNTINRVDENDNAKTVSDEDQRYVVLRSGQNINEPTNPNSTVEPQVNVPEWIKNKQGINDISLFGALNSDGTYTTTSDNKSVGGQFEKLIQTGADLLSSGLADILVSLGISSNMVKVALGMVMDAIEKVGDRDLVNQTAYQIVTGQWSPDNWEEVKNSTTSTLIDNQDVKHDALILLVKKVLDLFGFDTTASDLDKKLTIFPGNEPFVQDGKIATLPEFNEQFNAFMANNPDVFNGMVGIENIPDSIAAKLTNKLTGGVDLKQLVSFQLQGAKNGLYGVGLGQLYIIIGLWIGVVMQTFIFDRGKRVTKTGVSQWYISKTMLMATVAILQVTCQVWVAYASGLHIIGLEGICFLWLWLIATDLMFVVIIQALWYLVRDESIGKFLAIVVLVLSLTSGGGTFPAFAQFGFFRVAGWFVPFTYALRGTNAIIFGISINGTSHVTTQVILNNWGAYFVYIAIFGFIGLMIGAPRRYKEMNWGSANPKVIAKGLIALGQNPDRLGFRTLKLTTIKGKKIYNYHWEALKPGFDFPLWMQCRQYYQNLGAAKWWKRKHHDPILKANISDEEIMTRND